MIWYSLYLSGSPFLRILLTSSSHLKVTTDIAGGGGDTWVIFKDEGLRSLRWEPFKFTAGSMAVKRNSYKNNIKLYFDNILKENLRVGLNLLTILIDSLNCLNCLSTSSTVLPSTIKTSAKSSVNNWHEYPIFIAVSVMIYKI